MTTWLHHRRHEGLWGQSRRGLAREPSWKRGQTFRGGINLQSAGSNGRFHGERGGRAGADCPPWTGSLCEPPGSPQCWRTKPEREQDTCALVTSLLRCRHPSYLTLHLYTKFPNKTQRGRRRSKPLDSKYPMNLYLPSKVSKPTKTDSLPLWERNRYYPAAGIAYK